MSIGIKIRELRKKKNLSQTKLAKLAGISNTFLSDVEVGRTNPSLVTLKKISEALEVDIKEFF